MKRDKKLSRLSHWWREVEAHSHDDEQLQRKLHLMEAELRHVLRERAGGSPQWKRNLAATTVLVAVVALAVGMLRFFGVPDVPRTGLEEAIAVAGHTDTVFVKAVEQLPAGDVTTTSASPASKAGVRKARTWRVAHSRPQARVTAPPKEVVPAVTEERPAAAPAPAASPPPPSPAEETTPSPGDHGLDALALLSALESEFEK